MYALLSVKSYFIIVANLESFSTFLLFALIYWLNEKFFCKKNERLKMFVFQEKLLYYCDSVLTDSSSWLKKVTFYLIACRLHRERSASDEKRERIQKWEEKKQQNNAIKMKCFWNISEMELNIIIEKSERSIAYPIETFKIK